MALLPTEVICAKMSRRVQVSGSRRFRARGTKSLASVMLVLTR